MSALRAFVEHLKTHNGAAPGRAGPVVAQAPPPAPAPPVPPPPVLVSITIDPEDPTLHGAKPQKFRAFGTFSDGNTVEVTTKVHWISSAEGRISIDYTGLATPHVPGDVVITAVDPDNPHVRAWTTATASDAALESLEIEPDNPSFIGGVSLKLTAWGWYDDGSDAVDVTDQVVWTASPDDVVSINAGVVTPNPVSGDVTITAADPNNLDVTVSIKATVSVEDAPALTPDQEHDVKAEAFVDLEEALIQDPPNEARDRAFIAQIDTTMTALKQRPPDKVALKKLVKAGGGKVLDALVKNLPDPPDRATITAAIEARFNLKMTNIEADNDKGVEGNKSIKLIYLTLMKVPDRNVSLNKSLIEIDRKPLSNPDDAPGAWYEPGTKHAVFNAIRADDEGPELGDPSELVDVEDACKPKNKDKPKMLAFTALHEVGHGVDDDTSAMDSGGNAFAGWKVETLESVAHAVAEALHYDEVFIKELLTNPKPDDVLKPHDATEEQQKAAVAWCKAIRVDSRLWNDGAESAKRAIKGRVYHEAYPKGGDPQWVSYNLAARKQGITGYQFRAPGEWFAELYAAYYSGKLKPNHPYAAWLKKF
jgi:hypothetical protein